MAPISFLSLMLASALSLLGLVSASTHLVNGPATHRRHLVGRSPQPQPQNSTSLEKRSYDNARFSYYAAGLGACGTTNTAADFIVALNIEQWDGGSHCYAFITITYNGITATAQITDQCPGCPYGGLDMTQGLFEHFASVDAGIIFGSWDYVGAAPSTSSTPPPAITSTSTWTLPPPSTTSTTPTTTSQAPTPTSSSITTSSQASSTSTSSSASASASTSSNAPSTSSTSDTPSPTPQVQMLEEFNQAFEQLAELIYAAPTKTAQA